MADPEDIEIRRPINFRLPPSDRKNIMLIAASRGLTPGQLAQQIVARDLNLTMRRTVVRRKLANGEVLRNSLAVLTRISDDVAKWQKGAGAGTRDNITVQRLEAIRNQLDEALAEILATLGRGKR